MPSILFVCTANRFRSPLAAAIFLSKLNASNWRVESAGTWATAGQPAMKEAISEAQKRGLDISQHTSKLVNEKLIREFDLILVMESGQKEALLHEFPRLKDRIYLLTEVAGNTAYSISDPYITEETPEVIANEIENLIQKNFDVICNLVIRKRSPS